MDIPIFLKILSKIFTQKGAYADFGKPHKKKLADFETFAQIWVGGSGKNLI